MLRKNLLSIDIGNETIKVVEGKQYKNQVVLNKAYARPTPDLSFTDGRINDRDSIKGLLHGLLEGEKIKTKKAVCTVNSTSIITRELVLPFSKNEKDLETMVRFELEQYLPVILNDYVIEYKVVDVFMDEDVKKSKIIVVALPKVIVEGYLDILKELKLTPIALDINSNAVSKLFINNITINNENYSNHQAVAVIDLGYNYLSLSIVGSETSRFLRTINLGGKDIDINIANHFNMSLKDAEKKKINDCDLSLQSLASESGKMLNDIVKNSIRGWIQEIEKLFQYYTTRNSGNRIDHIYLYGGSSRIKGMAQYFNDILSIPTDVIKDMSSIHLGQEIDALEIELYLNAIGAIIRK